MLKIRKHIKPVFVIEQKGQDFTWTAKTPSSTHVNSFSLGKESEITYIDGKKNEGLCSLVYNNVW